MGLCEMAFGQYDLFFICRIFCDHEMMMNPFSSEISVDCGPNECVCVSFWAAYDAIVISEH